MGSLIVGGVILGADALLGGAVGNAAESAYTVLRDLPPPEESPIDP